MKTTTYFDKDKDMEERIREMVESILVNTPSKKMGLLQKIYNRTKEKLSDSEKREYEKFLQPNTFTRSKYSNDLIRIMQLIGRLEETEYSTIKEIEKIIKKYYSAIKSLKDLG